MARTAPHNATAAFAYLRDPEAIYRRSFALIRREVDLAFLPPDLRAMALRLVHTTGEPAIIKDLVWSKSAAPIGRKALAAGAEVLVDAEMVAAGITKRRARCTLNDKRVPGLAKRLKTTRSAAAIELWRPKLAGAIVAIGNAPTALFHLLNMLEDSDCPRPAAIIGCPVGFVGAAESKAALMAAQAAPALTVEGRLGGSAITVAAVNALASGSE
jgi:precorrin-8X/cobalt-precorrin-8 methylmutase